MKTRSAFNWPYFIKHIAIIAVPVALQNLLTTTGSMVDTMMLASLGEKTVGAVGLCAQFSSLMFSGYWGFVGGGMLFFSQYWGAGDEDGITRSYGLTLTFMMTVGFLFAALALTRPEFVMNVYTDKTEIQSIGITYSGRNRESDGASRLYHKEKDSLCPGVFPALSVEPPLCGPIP